MKVKFIQSIASERFAYRIGEFAYLEPELAQKWIESGICVLVARVQEDTEKPTSTLAPSLSSKPTSAQLRQQIEKAQSTLEQKQAEYVEKIRGPKTRRSTPS